MVLFCIFLMTDILEHLFICLFCHLYIFFGKVLSKCFVIKKIYIYFLLLSIENHDYMSFVRCMSCIYFLTVYHLSFHSFDIVKII